MRSSSEFRLRPVENILLMFFPFISNTPRHRPRQAICHVRAFDKILSFLGCFPSFSVVGLQVTQEAVVDIVKSNPLCNSEEDFVNCYLLDDGGYVISATTKFNNNSHVIGYFFGYVERAVMKLLVNNSVFET